jgi:RNA polymerase sigma factor (sigma-70 family)
MAMSWLDLVRYADTVGYHGDQDHNISSYRDWVIDAFNDNTTFDRFTAEQLAGDLGVASSVEIRDRWGEHDAVLDEMTAPSASPLEQLISHEQVAQVRQSLARLKPLDRDTLLAFYYDGQSLATISQQVAAPLGTIKRRLHVARQRLRQELAWVE